MVQFSTIFILHMTIMVVHRGSDNSNWFLAHPKTHMLLEQRIVVESKFQFVSELYNSNVRLPCCDVMEACFNLSSSLCVQDLHLYKDHFLPVQAQVSKQTCELLVAESYKYRC